jgi:hypothetical protein
MAIGQLEFSVTPEWDEFAKDNPWAAFIPEYAVDERGQKYMRKRGSSVVYKIEGDESCVCASCNSEIEGATVAHPIWDGPFPMSGDGRVHNEEVPYCPKCEKKPNFHGSPLNV